jgi:GntR family transcriptional regulator
MSNSGVQYSINLKSSVAVFVQIENQVQFAIASGKYKPGDTLPPVRAMAETVNVNPNTVIKAYRDLEVMKIVYTRRGVGVIVAEGATKLCEKNVHSMVLAHLSEAVGECVAAGIAASEINAAVKAAMDKGARPYHAR